MKALLKKWLFFLENSQRNQVFMHILQEDTVLHHFLSSSTINFHHPAPCPRSHPLSLFSIHPVLRVGGRVLHHRQVFRSLTLSAWSLIHWEPKVSHSGNIYNRDTVCQRHRGTGRFVPSFLSSRQPSLIILFFFFQVTEFVLNHNSALISKPVSKFTRKATFVRPDGDTQTSSGVKYFVIGECSTALLEKYKQTVTVIAGGFVVPDGTGCDSLWSQRSRTTSGEKKKKRKHTQKWY